jgi:xanthine/CO dehydrogenase XdhC/CoxF family maturation factor
MLLAEKERLAGSVSGGCLEDDLISNAWEKTANGPVLVTYDATADDDIVWGYGLGCNGLVQVLLERLPEDGGVLQWLAHAVKSPNPFVLATCISEGEGLGSRLRVVPRRYCPSDLERQIWTELGESQSKTATLEGSTYLIERIRSVQVLYIFGAGHDARPLAEMASQIGFYVVVIDQRESYCNREHFPSANELRLIGADDWGSVEIEIESNVVVMTHNYLRDLEILGSLLGSEVEYIGLLGPRSRTEKMLAELGIDDDYRLHSPIGLDLGADGPEQIALAILAELVAEINGRKGGFLRDRKDGIH